MASPTLLSLKYDKAANTLEVLDQLVIPHDTRYVPVTNSEEAWAVIRKMQVGPGLSRPARAPPGPSDLTPCVCLSL